MVAEMPVLRIAALAAEQVRQFVPRLWGVLRELFHEITGFIFCAFALFFAFGSSGLIELLRANEVDSSSLTVSALCVLMFAWFGVSSFRRARRISRER